MFEHILKHHCHFYNFKTINALYIKTICCVSTRAVKTLDHWDKLAKVIYCESARTFWNTHFMLIQAKVSSGFVGFTGDLLKERFDSLYIHKFMQHCG